MSGTRPAKHRADIRRGDFDAGSLVDESDGLGGVGLVHVAALAYMTRAPGLPVRELAVLSGRRLGGQAIDANEYQVPLVGGVANLPGTIDARGAADDRRFRFDRVERFLGVHGASDL